MLNLMQGKVRKILEHIGTGGKFLYRTPMAHAFRSKIDKQNPIGLKHFCKAKDTVNMTEWPPTNREKSFTNSTSSLRLTYKIFKELKKLDFKEQNSQLRNGLEVLEEMFTIFSNQRNANKNDPKILHHPSQNG